MFKVAIAGCGLIAVKKHIPAFLALKGKTKLAAVCDLNKALARKAADDFKIKKVYTDFSEMLSQEKPDIVDICTPPKTHASLTVQALENGSHVFLEKPMAISVSECDTMIEAAVRCGRQICVIHNQTFNPAFIRAREMVLRGDIGDFLGMRIFLSTPKDYMTSKKGHWAHQLPGGVLGETGPHAVYLALAFLKDIRDADVRARKIMPEYPWSEFEDYRITLLAENGITSITLFYGSNQWAADIDVMGSKGSLKIDLEAQTVARYERSNLGAQSIGMSTLQSVSQALSGLCLNSLGYIFARRQDAHKTGIQKFVDSILDDKPVPVAAGEGRETVRVMEMIVGKLKCAA